MRKWEQGNRRVWGVLVLSVVLCLGGCEKRIDGSSQEAFDESVGAMAASLEEPLRSQVGQALLTLAFADIDNLLQAGAVPPETRQAMLRARIDGMTAEQIVADAATVAAARAERQAAAEVERAARQRAEEAERQAARRLALETERQSLLTKQATWNAARAVLAQVQVVAPTLSLQPQRFGEPHRIISLTVVNQTASTISRIAFNVRLMATGREVPIVTDQVSYQIPGGLQPGETATWSLRPNMFSEIGRATPREGNFLQMTVEDLLGADGVSLVQAEEFRSWDVDRLVAIEAELAGMPAP